MCECGIVVDDVHERHLRTLHEHGTHSIQFKHNDHVIPLVTCSALAMFQVKKQTKQEKLVWSQEDIIDIAIENWNPQEHQQELLTSKPSISTAHMVITDNTDDDCDYSDTKTYDRDLSVHVMNALADADIDPLDQFLDDDFFDSEEELFFNAEDGHSGESNALNKKDPGHEDDDLPHLIQCVKVNTQPQRS